MEAKVWVGGFYWNVVEEQKFSFFSLKKSSFERSLMLETVEWCIEF